MSKNIETNDPSYPGRLACLSPKTGNLLEDYLIGELSTEAAAGFCEHLLLCFYCQDMYFRYQSVFESVRKNIASSTSPYEKAMEVGGGGNDT